MGFFQSGNFDYGILRRFGTHEENYTWKIINPKYYINGNNKSEENRNYTEKCTVNDEKLANNLLRTRNRIYELASCNAWSYFVTLTFSREKIDRTTLALIIKLLSQFIRDCGKKYGFKIDYLLVPELHADMTAWHLHGLIRGLPIKALKEFTGTKKTPKRIREMIRQGRHIYSWTDFDRRFGYCTFEPVRNHEAVSKYITKYITKDLERMVSDLGAHMFYSSKGLKSAEVVAKGQLTKAVEADLSTNDKSYYENEYVRVKRLYSETAAFSYFEYGDIPTMSKGDKA